MKTVKSNLINRQWVSGRISTKIQELSNYSSPNPYTPASAFSEELLLSVPVQFSLSVVFDSLQHHGLQHAWLPCPSPTSIAYSNSYPLSQWSHPNILSSVIPFSSCLQSCLLLVSFQWVTSSHQVAKVLGFQFRLQSFQWIFRNDFL